MKIDKLKQYIALHQSLLNEKTALERRLAEINKALGSGSMAAPMKTAAPSKPTAPAKAASRRRIKNPMSLKEAVIRVTSGRPLTKPEILDAIKKLGYRFTAADPTNSLNVVLYTKGQFKNHGGKFSPAK